MKLHEMKERRGRLTTEARGLVDAAKSNGGNMDDNAQKRFDEIETEVRSLNQRIDQETRVAEWERQAEATPLNGDALPDFERELRSYSLIRAAAHLAGIRGVDAAREQEIGQEVAKRSGLTFQGMAVPYEIFRKPRHLEQRVLLSGTSGLGVVPTEHHSEETVDFLYNSLVTARLGARVLTGLVGNVSIPSVDIGATSAWIAENGALSPADYDLNSKTASPKHVGALTEASRNMLQQSSPGIEQLFRDDMAANLAASTDGAALQGGGANEPDGITQVLSDAGDLSTFATPTWAEMQAIIAEVDGNNALNGSLGWAMHSQCAKKLKSTVRVGSTDSRFIMESPNELGGYQAYTTNALTGLGSPADRGIIFGNWSDLLIAQWGPIDFLANPYETTAYSKGNVQFRALATVDVIVRRNKSFRAARDMNTAS